MKHCLALVLGFAAWVFAQGAAFSDYVVGSAEGEGASVTFYLQNVSACLLEEVSLRVAHDAVSDATEAGTLVVNLAPGEVGTFVLGLSQALGQGWGWTVDQVKVSAAAAPCPAAGVVTFEQATFGGAAASTRQRAATGAATGGEPARYTVRAGDSLWRIAQAFGTSVDALLELNARTTTALSVGETLLVPAPQEGRIGAGTFPIHTVAAGDTLWSLAQRYGTTVALLEAANCLSNSQLAVGRQLRLPPPDSDETALRQACG